jgi:2-C-methyl-D-erythritol 4-phosphate cytidylyltransferase
MSSDSSAAVIVAAGRGLRFAGNRRKQFVTLGGQPILEWAVRAFRSHPSIRYTVVVLPSEEAESPPDWLTAADRTVEGGDTRAASVSRGVAAVEGNVDRILVHDGVRPFVSPSLIGRVCEAAARGPVVPILSLSDTIKEVDSDGRIVGTSDRSRLCRAQTPQGFPADLLRRLCATAPEDASITDDAMLCERAGIEVETIEGEPHNIKITSTEDMEYARWLIENGLIVPP